MTILPEGHPLAAQDPVRAAVLCREPFLLLGKDGNNEVLNCFTDCGLTPRVRFTTWDDYAIMSMVECGLGVSVLPRLILQRIPYRIAVRRLDIPAHRNIGIALREKKRAPLAVKRFLEYLPCRRPL